MRFSLCSLWQKKDFSLLIPADQKFAPLVDDFIGAQGKIEVLIVFVVVAKNDLTFANHWDYVFVGAGGSARQPVHFGFDGLKRIKLGAGILLPFSARQCRHAIEVFIDQRINIIFHRARRWVLRRTTSSQNQGAKQGENDDEGMLFCH